MPKEFVGVYDAEAYRKSQEYTRVQTRFGILTSTYMLAVTLGFWFAGGFQALDTLVRSWELGLIWTGLAYIGLLGLGKGLLDLPFRVYDTFVIEAHFGFNNQWNTLVHNARSIEWRQTQDRRCRHTTSATDQIRLRQFLTMQFGQPVDRF